MNAPILHRGKLAKHPRILSVRPLTREDLARVKQGEGRVIPRVKFFRDSHHRLARLCASGLRDMEILRITGFSASRLSTFKQDPAFQQLIAEYRAKVDEAFVASQDEFYETSVSNMLRAERQIEEHIDRAEENNELIPLKTLMALTADRADRFGYSKKTVNMNVNVDYAAKLEKIAARRGSSNVIDAKANSASLVPSGPEDSSPCPDHTAVPAGFRRRV